MWCVTQLKISSARARVIGAVHFLKFTIHDSR
nr:MAG TPA: hypothetical protein [Caudoviricetes sp.]